MQITIKRDDIKATVEEDGVVIWMNISLPDLLPIYAEDMQSRTKIGVVPDGYFEKEGKQEPLYLYDSEKNEINLVVEQKTAEKIKEKDNGFGIQYRLWNKKS